MGVRDQHRDSDDDYSSVGEYAPVWVQARRVGRSECCREDKAGQEGASREADRRFLGPPTLREEVVVYGRDELGEKQVGGTVVMAAEGSSEVDGDEVTF